MRGDQGGRGWSTIATEARQAVAAEERERPSIRPRPGGDWEYVDELLRGRTDRRTDEWVQVGWPYQVGLLAYGRFRDALSYGRSLGLTITLYPGGGILARRGYAVADGRWGSMRQFLLRFEQLQEEWNNDAR